jgi:methyl-accepting chemotaxis protein
MHAREKEDGIEGLSRRTASLVASLKQLDESSRQAVTQAFSILGDRLPSMLIKLAPMNDGVQLQYAGISLEGDEQPVDAFTQMTGGVATVFKREGDDFRRVTTSLKKKMAAVL